MCSLSWYHQPGGYEVFFNRDEKKTRGRATPPALQEKEGVRYLSPRDADAGGTWLLANEHGVTLALLNYWHSNAEERIPTLSRGLLLSSLAAQKSAEAAVQQVRAMSLTDYGSFTLAAFDHSIVAAPWALRWDGRSALSLAAEMPLCSSSFLPEAVIATRQQSFQTLPNHLPETLWSWHRDEASPSAYSVRMNRPDAQTWCISRVSVTTDSIRWRYIEEFPDLKGDPQEHETILKR
ncbi:MAG: NRDE family protein [Verrucomicrobiaceae bacterium]|nr:NRDE family protein [Verrucomicrobiaceae bacterium]